MKKRSFLLLLIIVAFLASCSEKDERSSEDYEPEILDVQVTINPEKGEVNEPVVIEAAVTYGDKKVTDPDDIKFELWRSHDENHESIEPEHSGDGIFKIEKSFTEEGTYYIIAHVTAEKMHNMPKVEFVIGEPSEPETESKSTIMEHSEMEHSEMEHTHENK